MPQHETSNNALAAPEIEVGATEGDLRFWRAKEAMVGYDPEVITSDRLGSELEILESIAAGLSPGIQANNRRLNGMARMLRWVGWMLIAAPACGAAAYALILPAGAAILRFQSGLA